ncbi:MAG: aminotransferase class V-fold PLP-dependent enzyme [Planctomycetes bacterium]|nr:aminotransferase class V-fold PLP-dependent enzyme [Planctomycetota bacterium]
MPNDTTIYLDNHATTRVDPRVLAAMLPYFSEEYGNAGSTHRYGHVAKDAVDAARQAIAASIGAQPREIVFTSGATESNNLALRGVCERQPLRGNHLLSVVTEHRAILDPLSRLTSRGFDVTLLPVLQAYDRLAGRLEVDRFRDALTDKTVLVSVMLANNEIGVLQPIAELAALCRERGILLHCDATQAVGKIAVDVRALGVDLMSFTAHKIYGPKGIGALYVRRSAPPVRLLPQITGGGHEAGFRSGTLNVPGIVGLAAALELCRVEQATEATRLGALRDRLFAGLEAALGGITLNGPALEPALRLPGNLNVGFAGVDGEALMMAMKRLAVSSGAACTSINPEPSHVLRSLGLGDDLARASLRFGIGRFNTADEIETAIELVTEAVQRLRQLASSADVSCAKRS